MSGKYKMSRMNSAVLPVWRDGVHLQYMEGTLHLFGGWNSQQQVILINEHRTSTDRGKTWTQLNNAGWSPRHAVGSGVVSGNTLCIWGLESGGGDNDAWKYTTASGWSLVNSNLGLTAHGVRVMFASCVHKNYLYAACGAYHTDVVRSNDYGNTWAVVGDLPSDVSKFNGALVSFKGDLYYIGGRNDAYVYSGKIYKSSDDGATWNLLLTDPVRFGTQYLNAAATSDAIFVLKGSTSTNLIGCFYSFDGLLWQQLNVSPSARHATGICAIPHTDEIIIACGNDANDALRLKKINNNHRYYGYMN